MLETSNVFQSFNLEHHFVHPEEDKQKEKILVGKNLN